MRHRTTVCGADLWLRLLLLVLTTTTTTTVQSFNLFFNDWFDRNNDSILFPKIRCYLALLRIGRILDFNNSNIDRYTSFLRNDSVVELVQTGIYQGANNIEEYLKFSFYAYSPYILSEGETQSKNHFLGYNNGQCIFLATYSTPYTMDPTTTNAPSSPFDVVYMLKTYLDFEQRYISRINVYYTNDFLRIYFDKFLNSDKTRTFVCNVMEGPCMSILNTTYDNTTCTAILKDLPTADGTDYYIDGKSQGCRALHAVFANTNPINHCAHLSYTPLQDPAGNIKCQISKNKLPSELFTEQDFQLFKSFAESEGIDPIKGHTSNE
jgi:hypothetical protein